MALTAKQEAAYVYALVDPRDGSIFYIGKGTGRRMYAHERDVRRNKGVNLAKCARIAEILGENMSTEYRVLGEYETEDAAYSAERAFIAMHDGLTNIAPGGAGGRLGQENYQTTLAKAKDLLGRVVPYFAWADERERTAQECATRSQIVEEIIGVIDWCRERMGQASVGSRRAARLAVG